MSGEYYTKEKLFFVCVRRSMRAAFVVGIVHNFLALTSNFFELRAERPDTPQFVHMPPECVLMANGTGYCEIPVKMKNEITSTKTIVSPEDYERLVAIAPEWRISNGGYVVTSRRVHGKYRLTYMHKEVAGSTSRHLNGDRLDNRRENLVPTRPKPPPIQLTPESPFDIQTRHPVMDFVYAPEDLLIEPVGKYHTIQYPSGKIYSGETHNGLPHGLGTLLERNRSSFGWFLYGQFKNGCVIDHPEVGDRLRHLYRQKHIRPIKAAFVVLPSGKHVNLVEQ